jgi:ubiquinone/menaquinone biosynthesis C-methylase UbiE
MILFVNLRLDFGYPWWLSYGHVPILAGAAILLTIAYLRKWPKWSLFFWGLILLWSVAGFIIFRFLFDINVVPTLPTESFLRSGNGHVLDLGAGTGRSSIMVLKARPGVTLVASDLFGESFDQHFGHSDTPQQRLLANLKAAGVDQRATIERADMRKLPFPNSSFDAIVSAYAMDHLNRDGIGQALCESARVIKPGGEFLLILIAKEPWVEIALPILLHADLKGSSWWTEQLRQSRFQVLEQGTSPATLYLLSRKL